MSAPGEAAIEHNSEGPSESTELLPSNTQPSSTGTPKKMWQVRSPVSNAISLSSIMAEEQVKAQEESIARQEAKELQDAIQVSMIETQPVVDDIDEDMKLAMAMSMQIEQYDTSMNGNGAVAAAPVVASAAAASADESGISESEMEQIEKALREADIAEQNESLALAMELQNEEDSYAKVRSRKSDSHVRLMTRGELLHEKMSAQSSEPTERTVSDVGFRINSSTPSTTWSRLDRATIVGPNQELRTKHDVQLQGQANAHRLGMDEDDGAVLVGNKAYNSFRHSMQQRRVHKGVAAHGHGRATADVDKTKQGGMDSKVRRQIAKAINNGLIEQCNGVVKEGKEAIVYHANQGVESGGYDVAVKVFKRIQEFKERYSYVDGDPRYLGRKFNNASSREQLEIWAEKEFRNLVRAHRGGVPVPTPLLQKENVLFMRFLGDDGWPSPQLREVDLKKGSKKWRTLYDQTMNAIRRLYKEARLVHGDLSEYNIMVCPSFLVENRDAANDGDDNAVQVVMIDFGQSVDVRHPSSLELLQRDILRVKQFFDKMGVKTLSEKETEDLVMQPDEINEADEVKHSSGEESAKLITQNIVEDSKLKIEIAKNITT